MSEIFGVLHEDLYFSRFFTFFLSYCVNHEHVIQQLSEFGVPSFYLRLLRAYLDSHQQIVVFDGQDFPIGMPQLGFETRVVYLSVNIFHFPKQQENIENKFPIQVYLMG